MGELNNQVEKLQRNNSQITLLTVFVKYSNLLFLIIILVDNWFCYHFLFQLSFFRKGLKHLEAVEPHVKAVAEQQHIDYHFAKLDDDDDENNSEIYNDDGGENDEDDDGFSTGGDSDRHSHDGQLNFEYRSREPPTSANSMEVIFLFRYLFKFCFICIFYDL